jgi:RimJ/RimL family protein N-acetyltransferase
MIYLDTIEESDLETMRSWRNNPRIHNWCRQTGLISKIDQLNWYKRQNDDPNIRMFKIISDDGEVLSKVGICGLTSIDYNARRAEFSCYVAPHKQGNGYAKDALKALFHHGFASLNLRLIWGETFSENPARHMFEKLGMVREGVRRQFYFKNGKYIDAILYSITKEEFYGLDNPPN